MAQHWVEPVLQRLLFRRDGTRRRLVWRVLFSPGDGRMFLPFRRLLFKKSGMTRPFVQADLAEALKAPALAAWMRRYDTAGPQDLALMDGTAHTLPAVLIRIDGDVGSAADPAAVRAALDAVAGLVQRRAVWLPGDAPAAQRLAGALAASADPEDATPRPGEVILVIGAGVLPRPVGPRLLVEALAGAAMAYGDEVALDADGLPVRPWFKPRFSPELAARGVLIGRMAAIDPARVPGLSGSAALSPHLDRIALDLPPGSVTHVPHVVFCDPQPRPSPLPEILPPLPDPRPTVSVIIPTRNGWSMLEPCLASLEDTDWPHDRLEIIVVDNGSTEADCLDGLAAAETAGRITVLRDARPFNFARLNNEAVAAARGALLVFLNNDTLALRADWLDLLARHAMQPGIGAVGPKLLYGDGSVQHGGVILGVAGGAVHAHLGLPADAPGYIGLACLTHEVSAVTGACLAIARSAFEAVGGFDDSFAVAFNDVALCCTLMQHGYRNLYVAEPLFAHLESRTRGPATSGAKQAREEAEAAAFRALFPDLFRADPNYSPNLSLGTCYATLVPPRT